MTTRRSEVLRRVDAALEQPEIRASFEEYKRLFAVAQALYPSQAHEPATIVASAKAHSVVDLIDPRGELPREAVYRYLANVAVDEMLPAHPAGARKPSLIVELSPGRLHGARDKVRAQLIAEVRAGLPRDHVPARGRELAAKRWPVPKDPADREAERKRVDAIMRDARTT